MLSCELLGHRAQVASGAWLDCGLSDAIANRSIAVGCTSDRPVAYQVAVRLFLVAQLVEAAVAGGRVLVVGLEVAGILIEVLVAGVVGQTAFVETLVASHRGLADVVGLLLVVLCVHLHYDVVACCSTDCLSLV